MNCKMKIFLPIFCFSAFFLGDLIGRAPSTVPITLEFAKTPDELSWGLMKRDFLPQNHGMLFLYSKPHYISFWSFNCSIDLSLALIDKNGIVKQIEFLKAYPEKMDPKRPVNKVSDISNYPLNDPIVLFYESQSIHSSVPVQYVLEMNAGWYLDNNISIGDKIIWNEINGTGQFIKKR
jgi:uncharacterized protein